MHRRSMIALVVATAAVVTSACASSPSGPAPTTASDPTPTTVSEDVRVVATGLDDPYEIVLGPDDFIWVTEKSGKRVVRVNPDSGEKKTALEIPEAVHTTGGQDGVLGLALHPDLLTGRGRDHVYLAHTYRTDAGPRTKIVRYTYDPDGERLHSPKDLITGMPAGHDHQAARLVFGPDGKLYYTIGDQGANQFSLYCEPIRAQELPTAAQVRAEDWDAYRGKVLRLETDGSIPRDNPELEGVRSHVYSYGHRNPQGLAFSPDGLLYSSEQGPKTDDEVNVIRAGRNYGWPHIAGYRDDRAYVYADWSAARGGCASVTYDDYTVPEEVPQEKETDWTHPDFTPPIRTFYTVDDGYEFQNPKCGGMDFMCWPTLAPASLEVHPDGKALLMPSLKDGAVYRLRLAEGGERIVDVAPLGKTVNRYRDTTVSRDGRTVYVATDSTGITRDALGVPTKTLTHPGAILAFPYRP
ncbi:glucose/sorbosone family PQQ-dependent dehydrogenase [Thermostaphylospora chromogena]|mgnify:CR=1 FL=1|uniref:Dehydrogenase, PQQ-dependent, s-GDH family n=1 Tax=Thermostaphylospora chromogena TaxID=35622 RepID=A0A1H1D2F6_9ACTN|nr:glucose/sorbosone family PQQ-dependent dehydrogenase [Thermostaphylospora chromogena]SDQ70328.1 dehydrogenase, PQQ-dependent, s-GDH family [Thermostaphylospora chromogena]